MRDSDYKPNINDTYFFAILVGLLPIIMSSVSYFIWTFIYRTGRFNL